MVPPRQVSQNRERALADFPAKGLGLGWSPPAPASRQRRPKVVPALVSSFFRFAHHPPVVGVQPVSFTSVRGRSFASTPSGFSLDFFERLDPILRCSQGSMLWSLGR